MRQNLTGQPKVLAGLTTGVAYTIQNRSDHPIFVQTAAAAPTDGTRAFILASQDYGVVKKEGSEEAYVWTVPQIDSGFVVYDEEA